VRRFRTLIGSLAVAALLGLGGAPNTAVAADIAIGTGEPGSAYHKLGRALCRLIDLGSDEHGLTCEPLATPGGLFNLANVRGGALEFGLVPSDLHYYALQHAGPFQFVDATYEDIRSLFSPHAEFFTLVARRDAGIASLDDLKGRRINKGVWGSAERGFVDALIAAKGWTSQDFLTTEDLPVSQQSLSLCHGRLDAIVYSASHPNRDVARVLQLCDAVLVDVAADELAAVRARNPFYVAGQIPADSYPQASEPVTTFGIKVTLVSSAETDDETVHAVVKAVFENLDRLKRSNRPLLPVEPAAMTTDGLTAPLHEGAKRYFEEAGLM
jgi:TRAP transporter TAXI family solute receptor